MWLHVYFPLSSHSLTVLAHICAEVCCSIDRVARELLGALRSLCIPSTCSTYKGCMTGFTQLTARTDVCHSLLLYPIYIPFMYMYVHVHTCTQGCGNSEPIAGHFDLHCIFNTLVLQLYTAQFQFTRHSLDLSDNVLHDWLCPHHCMYM